MASACPAAPRCPLAGLRVHCQLIIFQCPDFCMSPCPAATQQLVASASASSSASASTSATSATASAWSQASAQSTTLQSCLTSSLLAVPGVQSTVSTVGTVLVLLGV